MRTGRITVLATLLAPLLFTLPGQSARAAGVEVRGKKCAGSRVVSCIEVHYDTDRKRARAWASVFDNGNDDQDPAWRFEVALHDIALVGADEDPFKNLDHDGWFDTVDVGNSSMPGRLYYDCLTGKHNVTFGAIALWRWPDGRIENRPMAHTVEICD